MAVDRHKRGTRFHTFLKSQAIGPSELARRSGYSRQYVYLVRVGKKEPSMEFVRAAIHAVWRIKSKHFRAEEMFDLEARPRRKAS